jgi:hypothetical protein
MRRAHRPDQGTARPPLDPEAATRRLMIRERLGELLAELREAKRQDLDTKRSDPTADRKAGGRAIYDLMRRIAAMKGADLG